MSNPLFGESRDPRLSLTRIQFSTDAQHLREIERLLDEAKVPDRDFSEGQQWSVRDRVFALIHERDEAKKKM